MLSFLPSQLNPIHFPLPRTCVLQSPSLELQAHVPQGASIVPFTSLISTLLQVTHVYLNIPSQEPHMRESMWHLSFQAWVKSLTMIFSRSVHLSADLMISFFLTAEQYPVVHIYLIFLSHSSVEDCLVCFYFLACVSGAAANMAKQASVTQDVESFGNIPRIGVFSWGCVRLTFSFLKVLHTNLHNGCTCLLLHVILKNSTLGQAWLQNQQLPTGQSAPTASLAKPL